MANYGKYYIAVRLLLLKQYLEANAGRNRIVKRREPEQLYRILYISKNFRKDAVYLFSKSDCSAKSNSGLNEQRNKEKLLIPSRNQEFFGAAIQI